ncbi:MAG: MCE family protein [Paludibacteraceae bacterium]|nr:MCE family protein [Paludibacteraceae bacterium]
MKNIKYAREIKVGVLALVCMFLLIFGFNYLKGVNIFSSVLDYHGRYVELKGLTEQAPVYVRGYKVGQVNQIRYDFTKDSAFVVDVSINKDIALPIGTQMVLVSDGLLGGMAIELRIPTAEVGKDRYKRGDFIPTMIVPGLIESIEAGVLNNIDATIVEARVLVENLNRQLSDDHLQHALANIDNISEDLAGSSKELKKIMMTKVPGIVEGVDTVVDNVRVITDDIRRADLNATVARADAAIDQVYNLIADVRSDKGTLGMLINDKTLYNNINTTVVSADSLLVDLKAHPKRYVHFSMFGKKEK